MNTERPRDVSETGEDVPAPPPARESAGEPVVTDSPSSHQPHRAPPAGSEPQGRTTMIAAIGAVVIVAALVIFLFL